MGYDIEVNGIGPTIEGEKNQEEWVRDRPGSKDPRAQREEAAAQNVKRLYQTLADLLVVENGLVSYATAAFVTDNGRFTDGLFRFGHTRVQPIGLVQGRPHLLARIMAYDESHNAGVQKEGSEVLPGEDSLGGRHRQILEAARRAGIHPSTIQPGVSLELNRAGVAAHATSTALRFATRATGI